MENKKLKTLKNIEFIKFIKQQLSKDYEFYRTTEWNGMQIFKTDYSQFHIKEMNLKIEYFIYRRLKQEAIKWIKEDFKSIDNSHSKFKEDLSIFNLRWIERFNITEDDLK